MIKRTIDFRFRFHCYDDRIKNRANCKGDRSNWPTGWYEFGSYDIKDEFEESLSIWGDMVADQFEDLLEVEGDKNCNDTAKYLHLCEYEYEIVSVREEEIPEERKKPRYIPKYVRETIEYLERELEKYKDIPASQVKIKEEIDRLKERYGIE